MRIVKLKIKKTLKAVVKATAQEVKIKFPKQSLGTVAIFLLVGTGEEKLVRQFELTLSGDSLNVERIK